MKLDTERHIIEQAKTNPEAFGTIFDRYYPKLLAFMIRRTGDVGLAQEVVSETFMKALKNLAKFRWRGISIEAWLFRIAINELRMHFRSNAQLLSLDHLYEQDGFEPQADYDLAQETLEAQERLTRHEQFVRAINLIHALPAKYQDILLLRFVERKKIADIAQIVGKKEGTVKSLLSRGRAQLQRELAKQPAPTQPIKQPRIVKDMGTKRSKS